MDDLKRRVSPEPGESHSVCLDVWELPANLIGRSGGVHPHPSRKTVFCGWSFRCQTTEGWPPLWSPRWPGSCVSGFLFLFHVPFTLLAVCSWGGPNPQLCRLFWAQGETPRPWSWNKTGQMQIMTLALGWVALARRPNPSEAEFPVCTNRSSHLHCAHRVRASWGGAGESTGRGVSAGLWGQLSVGTTHPCHYAAVLKTLIGGPLYPLKNY